jgi:hypothetical protein
MSLIQIDRSQIQDGEIIGSHLSSGAKSSVLASKNLAYLKVSADLTNPNADTVTIQSFPETSEFPFSTTAGVIGDGSAVGTPVLLELTAGNSGAAHGFNTNSNKVWGGQKPFYAADVYDLNGQPLTDPDNGGNKVWAVITADARTTGGTYKIRFYSDEWPASGEVVLSNPVTVAEGYFLAYSAIAALGDLPLGFGRSDTAPLSKTAAGIGAGDIGTAEIADGAVTTAKLADDAVTADKIAAGTITSAELADNAVGTAEIADNAVTADKIAAGAVGLSELADNAVGTDKIADDAVTAAKIVAGAVSSSELADDAVSTAKIADAAVTTAKLQDSSVTADKIADGEIGTAELANGAVTYLKIADQAVKESTLDSDVILSRAELATVDPTFGGVVIASDTSAEGKVSALASPGMAVRVQTGGKGYTAAGNRVSIGTTASLAISASDADDPRYDAVVWNAGNFDFAVREGTPGVGTYGALSADDVLLAVVKVPATATEITSAEIFDHRRGAGSRRTSKVWTGSTATAYELPRRLRGTADVFRNGVNLIEAGSPATADEYAVTNPLESNGSVITLGAAPSSSTMRISGIV